MGRLTELRCLVQDYFGGLHNQSDNSKLLTTQRRQSINLVLAENRRIVRAASIATCVEGSFGSFAMGHRVYKVDLLDDIFNYPEELENKMVSGLYGDLHT